MAFDQILGVIHKAENLARGAVQKDDDYDEWSSIVALENSRKQLDWKAQLGDAVRLEEESDLERPGARLIHQHKGNFELLQELFVWRYRQHGSEGIKLLWRHILDAASLHKTRLWEFSRLWTAMENVVAKNHGLVDELMAHVKTMYQTHHDKPDRLYEKLMLDALQRGDNDLLDLHKKLETVWPDRKETKALFQSVVKHTGALQNLQSIAFQIQSFSGMYSFVVAHLTESKMLLEAFEWHRILVANGDIPIDTKAPRKLIKDLRKRGLYVQAGNVIADLESLDVAGAKQLSSNKRPTSASTGEIILSADSMQIDLEKGRNTEFVDHFISRLFATHFVSVETTIQMIQRRAISALTFREAILRVAQDSRPVSVETDKAAKVLPMHVNVLTDMLEKAGVKVEPSTYSQVIMSLAERNSSKLLQSVVESDQHPDAFEDLDLQEKLLAHYLEEGAQLEAERSLFIIRTKEPFKYEGQTDLDAIYLAIMPRHADRRYSLSIIERILRRHGEVSSDTFRRVWAVNVKSRSPKLQGFKYDELRQMIRILTMSMRSGTRIGPYAWKEAFRRLAWSNRLEELEALSVWLVEWCRQPSLRLQSNMTGITTEGWRNRNAPFLRQVFNKYTLQGLVAWGMRRWAINRRAGDAEAVASSETSESLRASDLLWGTRLLRKLKGRGLPFDPYREELREACRMGLVRMYGGAWSRKRINRRLQTLEKANFVDMAAAMEDIWGERIFLRKSKEPDDRRRLAAYQKKLAKAESLKISKGKLVRREHAHLAQRRHRVRRHLPETHEEVA